MNTESLSVELHPPVFWYPEKSSLSANITFWKNAAMLCQVYHIFLFVNINIMIYNDDY